MKIVSGKIKIDEIKEMAAATFGNMVKAAVDVEKEVIAVDAELHSDLEAVLLEAGSRQKNIWGINLYPDMDADGFVEFDSLINIRPSQDNRSRNIENVEIKKKIMSIVTKRIVR